MSDDEVKSRSRRVRKLDDQCAPPPKAMLNQNKDLPSRISDDSSRTLTDASQAPDSQAPGKKRLFGKFFGLRKDKSSGVGSNEGAKADDKNTGDSASMYDGGPDSNDTKSIFSFRTRDLLRSESGNGAEASVVNENVLAVALKVVIIGFSYSGATLSAYLEKIAKYHVKIIIIEQDKEVYFTAGAHAACLDVTLAPYLEVPINEEKVFKYKHNQIIRGSVCDITDEYVETKDGKMIHYDVLVVATGSIYPPPNQFQNTTGPGMGLLRKKTEDADTTHTKTTKEMTSYFQQYLKSKTILVIGGGLTGCEFTTRIRKDANARKVTLIHDKPMLLDDSFPEKFRKKLADKLKYEGVELLLNETAAIPTDGNFGYPPKGRWVETKAGTMIFSDIQINCTGHKGNTSFMFKNEKMFKKAVEETSNFIKVNRYMQVIGHQKIFAIGDCTNIDGIKCFDRIKKQVAAVGNSICNWAMEHVKLHLEEFGDDSGGGGGGSHIDAAAIVDSIKLEYWHPDSDVALDSIKRNEIDQSIYFTKEKWMNNENYPLEPRITTFGEISTRKVDDLKHFYRLLGSELESHSGF
ncbi:Apoptosis-inducing factor-like protein [Zancudomyces culisetae]|uniref:Apoptosis-inducing factor-like protein n=1 Tax=Zancudomyces culisetae TaxID=1213189 RepID=A0A1R1PQ66_ZANCU|nr:Apoptosis-inducing factor-like protein [Zancudomyces culisetae]|eukprot:OMH83081.1 Apoptosis-inducing factor-like protein [Zancudomyces culisetae]